MDQPEIIRKNKIKDNEIGNSEKEGDREPEESFRDSNLTARHQLKS
jgi:hypothetical protein